MTYPSNVSTVDAAKLRAYIDRIENLLSEKTAITEDINSVYKEADGYGYPQKILKKVIALRKKGDEERSEEQMIIDTYLNALGHQTSLDV